MTDPKVAIIIAAYNASKTILGALESALFQPEVAEIIVIDDCSSDETKKIVSKAAESDSRIILIEQPFNQGPSAARNRGLAHSTSPFVAVLDSDDIFLPGRFARIFAQDGWDLCADNIRFTRDSSTLQENNAKGAEGARVCTVDFETFVTGNIGDRSTRRRELGFLKPVIRRDFLNAHGLQFDERCRLGEDFVLYSNILARGARFIVLEESGYAALERDNSLSAVHSICHLSAFLRACRELAEANILTTPERVALDRHSRLISEKISHREILKIRRLQGAGAAIWAMTKKPTALRDILLDRLHPHQPVKSSRRLLIPSDDFGRLCE